MNLNIPTPKSIKKPLNRIRNLIIPFSTDESERNEFHNYVCNCFPNIFLQNNRAAEVSLQKSPEQMLYIIFIKENSSESTTYEKLFETYIIYERY